MWVALSHDWTRVIVSAPEHLACMEKAKQMLAGVH